MSAPVDLNKVVPSDQLQGETAEETVELNGMLQEAEAFIRSFKWCSDIEQSYFGFGIGGVVGVFLFKIRPAEEGVDEWIWVVVGDLPPAYIATDGNATPALALNGYIEEMRLWVEAATVGKSIEDLIPVNVPPTLENARQLKSRLEFLEKYIVNRYD